jgi:hypothetical protein
MGKSSKPIIGYWYSLGLHMGLCAGPIDALRKIVAGGKGAWSGNLTASTDFDISKPELFGGEKKEGGIDGTATLMMGEATQGVNAYLEQQLGSPMTAFRGLCTLLFRGRISALNPYIKAWSFQVSKWTAGWRTPVWQPSLCKVGEGMNGAHIVYRAITDPVTGLGRDPSTLDLDRMLEAAQTLYGEGLGFCFKWSRSDVLANFVQIVCGHAGGDFVDDPTTGLQYLKLFRGDYDPDSLDLLYEHNVSEVTEWDVAALAGSVNQITVKYHDCETNKDVAVVVQNLANIQAQGRVINQTNNYPGIWSADLATKIAMRDLHAVSSLPARGKIKVLGTVEVRKGDVKAFSWARLNLARLPVRVLEIDRGDGINSAMTLTVGQDVYAMPTTSYVVVQATSWTAPNLTPAPVPHQQLVEASWRDLAASLSAADLAQVAATSCYMGALGDRPPCVAYNYELTARIGSSGAFANVAAGPFAPSALLQDAMPAERGPTAAVLTGGSDLDQVTLPCEVLIDGELMRCDALDPVTGAATLARACVDTVPAAHASGARVWFTDGWTAADPTEYIAGESIQAKLLTRTGEGTLDPSLATTASITLAGRQDLPYAPARLRINGDDNPATAAAPITVSFARRNRLTQADQLVDQTSGDITPEDGQTTTVQVFNSVGTRMHEETGITGTSATPWSPATAGIYTVKVFSMRDGLASWQTAQWSVSITL